MPVKFKYPVTRFTASMHPFENINQLGSCLHFVCDKCQKQYGHALYVRPPQFLDIVKSIASLRKNGGLDDATFQELLRYMISIHVQREIEDRLTQKLDKALCEKLSPDNLFEALL